jgi:cholesterol oxidase
MFGVGNLEAIRHAAKMMKRGYVVPWRDDDPPYLTRDAARNLNIPIRLMQGAHNYIFLPAGSERTLEWLRRENGAGAPYERVVLDDYAHLDSLIGRDAAKDVYPGIVEFLGQN